jgi:hypothetical protein
MKGDRFVAVKVPGNRDDGENYIIVPFPIYCVGDQIKADETGGASSTQTQTRNTYKTEVEEHLGDLLEYVYFICWTTWSVPP